MKTYKNLYQKICSRENLMLAYEKARKGKSKKDSVIGFEKDLHNNLEKLRQELLSCAYKPRSLHRFIVRDPKTRTIHSSAFRDRVVHHALINIIGMRVSAAGIAAFLMLIGYSVDTDILLTTRALRTKGGTLNNRIYRAFKTGSFMTITALAAVLPAFLFISGLPDSFRQIFFILSLGLICDLFNTWLTNASIIKWYCVGRKIE